MEENGISKIRYAQPQHITHFMNRPRMAIKKQSTSITNTPAETDVTNDEKTVDTVNLNADLYLEKMQSSAIFTG